MTDITDESWKKMKATMKEKYNMTDISFGTWIESLIYERTFENIVTVIIPSGNARVLKYISIKYRELLQNTIYEITGHKYEVLFIPEAGKVQEEREEAEVLKVISKVECILRVILSDRKDIEMPVDLSKIAI